MARSREEEVRRRNRNRFAKGLVLGGAAVGIPALLNFWVSRRTGNLTGATWGTGDRHRWAHGDIAFQNLGEGRPLVLLHAFGPGHSSAEWRRVAEELAPRFEIYAPDLPGWGRSDVIDARHDAELHLAWLRDFLGERVRRPAVLVAAGLSAAYAVQLAVDQPEAVDALALVAPLGLDHHGRGPELGDTVMHGLLRLPILGTSAINVVTSRAAIASYLSKEVFASADLVDEALVDLHYLNSHRPGAQRSLVAYTSGYLDHDIEKLLGRISVPTWIAWGRQARNPPVEAADRWLTRIPRAELEIFERAGVLPHAESPGEFGRKLEAYLLDSAYPEAGSAAEQSASDDPDES